MISEFKKSVDGILSERLASPLYGTFIVSWMLWNWKIIYLTIFISDNKITGTKIDFIVNNYCNHWDLITYPAISTFILLTIMPFITIGAYWLQLWFNDKRLTLKNEREKNQLLTIEQSNAIRKEIREKEKEFNDLVVKKDETIKTLQYDISALKNEIDEISKLNDSKVDLTRVDLIKGDLTNISSLQKPWEMPDPISQDEDYLFLKKNIKASDVFIDMAKYIRTNSKILPDLDQDIKEFYKINDYIDLDPIDGSWFLTEKGERVYKIMFNEIFNASNTAS